MGARTRKNPTELIKEDPILRKRIKELEQSELKLRHSLQESKERYRSLVDNIDFGINLIDKDFKIIMTNAVTGKQFNKSASELVGKYCFQEFEKRETVCQHCPGVQAMVTGQPHQVDTKGIRDDGSHFSARIRALPLFYPDGTIKGFTETIEDITERKQTEAKLQKDILKRKQAEEALQRTARELRIKAQNLQEVNTTMKVLMNTLGKNQDEIQEKFLVNMKEQALRYLGKLKNTPLNDEQKGFIKSVEAALNEIVLTNKA